MDSILEKDYNNWLAIDQNPKSRQEIQQLYQSGEWTKLKKLLHPRIAFGTAGLRAQMSPGFACMNEVTVLQASQGVCSYVLKNVPDSKLRGVVIGYDHRYNSKLFAQLTASVFLRNRVRVYFYPNQVCTPLVPFTITSKNAACGVCITASHNPAKDNGYKLYWSNGVQIAPPLDTEIASEIDKNLDIEAASWNYESIFEDNAELVINPEQDVINEYYKSIKNLSHSSPTNAETSLKFVYTAMHGVGYPFAKESFESFGFPESSFLPVPEQKDPDPDFPTVSFPNPEERGALDLSIEYANKNNCTHVLANDPDADRFTAAEKQPDGSWNIFTGDQIGTMLGVWMLERYKSSTNNTNLDKIAMIASTVSSKMLQSVAKIEGFKFAETLTGFKYIGNCAKDLEDEGYKVLFGYEEAIGYMCGEDIKDKDGVSALVTFAEMTSELKRTKDISLLQYLDSLYSKYGYFATKNWYVISNDSQVTNEIFHELRWGQNSPKGDRTKMKIPLSMCRNQVEITSIRDLTVGYDSTKKPDYTPSLPTSSSSHMITFTANVDVGIQVQVTGTVRTSGTEPKIKYYLQGSSGVFREDPELAKESVHSALSLVEHGLCEEWLQKKRFGLK